MRAPSGSPLTRLTPLRIVAVSLALAGALVVVAVAATWVRFGLTDGALAARLERTVRHTVDARSTTVRTLARTVAAEGELIAEAAASRDRLAPLFERLQAVTAPVDGGAAAVTVYAAGATPGEYRVLAWSDGPGEQDLSSDRLAGPSALFVAPGHAGLRLLAVEPVLVADRVVAVAVAETVLAPIDRSGDPTITVTERRLETDFGPVTVIAPYSSAHHLRPVQGFTIQSDAAAPLIDVSFDAGVASGRRGAFLRRTVALALLPLAIGLTIVGTHASSRIPRAATARARWRVALWHNAVTLLAAFAVAAIFRAALLPARLSLLAILVGLLVCTVRVCVVSWWHAGRRMRQDAGTRFVVEQCAGGLLLAAVLAVVARGLERWITIGVLDRGLFVLFPLSFPHTLDYAVVLLGETILSWLAASVLAALAIRWRVTRSAPRALVAAAAWLAPAMLLAFVPSPTTAGWTVALAAGAGVAFGLAASALDRAYRRTTRSIRLLLALVAGIAPAVVLYPIAAVTADRATRQVVESTYAPATAGHPEELRAELARAQQRVDELPVLAELVSAPPSSDSQAAYFVWTRTGLERSRVISDVEIYDGARALVSRFAFNLPVYRTALQPWEGSSCTWEVFGEVMAFGSQERPMLHAERGVCDADGQLLGGVVLHVASPDYQALPFVSSPSPYYEMLGAPSDAATPRLPGVALAVYGWSGRPLFTTGPAAWPVSRDVFDRLYETGSAFWMDISTGDDAYHVHFSQSRDGVYALGVPRVALIEHATRLAEIVALACIFFVIWQAGLLAYAPFARRPDAPLRRVFHEIRTSFYRKLFLSFVIVAVVPVLVAAVAFAGYTTARFRADVEHEATTTVTVAARVFQELETGERSGAQQAGQDDVMVWIRQVAGHDVNLFDGPSLVATSQRDLFDSGFLPTRTPAAVYRAIALERRPSALAEDRVGVFSYLAAAAPVPLQGRNAVLTIPLAPRQREMARDLDTFNRRVLVGAVIVVLFAAGVGASLAGRISDPVARLTRATRQIAAGQPDVRVATDTTDELRRLVDDFNSMAATLDAQRTELARSHQLKAWNEMARQVAHEIKNPLTPVQLAAEHLHQVHEDRGRPLGTVMDRCLDTVLAQVRLLRQIASEFANFAGEPIRRPVVFDLGDLMRAIVEPYRVGMGERVTFALDMPPGFPPLRADRTLVSRALTNLVENAVQAMPDGGYLRMTATVQDGRIVLTLVDSGVGMDAVALAHAFEPYFSTKTAGSGLGLANARRNIEREGGTIAIASAPGRGTTVTVTFPVDPPGPDAGSSSGPAASR